MCGITGFFQQKNTFSSELLIQKMAKELSHRGPDAYGKATWNRCSLGHRRLSIIDLSASANQPFFSDDNRYALVYNGEIYNYQSIKLELQNNGISFKTNSDTEVLLKGYIYFGEKILEKLNGCFAFGIYDKQTERLFIARDRIGIKPLYYYYNSGHFVFGSELKPITAYPRFKSIINQQALKKYFAFGYIPAPLSIYENVFKLNPGHYIVIDKKSFNISPYWVLNDYINPTEDSSLSFNQQRTKDLLKSSINYRLIADVPVGSFLSGGIDSTLISHYMTKLSTKKIHTFNIGFHEKEVDETLFAKAAAKKISTTHHHQLATAHNTLETIHKLSVIYDEPFADSSGPVTYLVSQLARKNVKVALSGDGGDELYWGYNRYFHQEKIYNYWHSIPENLRPILTKILPYLPIGKVQRIYKYIEDFQHTKDVRSLYLRSITIFDKQKLAGLLNISPEAILFDMDKTLPLINKIQNPLELIALMDILYYLPDNLLTKVDRASMANGLEVRTPFLDHRLVEHAINIPFSQKKFKYTGKVILKNLLKPAFDSDFLNRPKKGFSIPLDKWLNNEMKFLIDEYLNPNFIRKQQMFDNQIVQNQVKRFYYNKGKGGSSRELWTLLIFQLWWKKWMD